MNIERLRQLFAPGGPALFTTTQWSLVTAAARSDSTSAQEALAELCSIYWYPLYAYARRRGHPPEDAQDLVQGFFQRVLGSRWLESASPQRGKFRSWVLAAFQHHISDEHTRATARKRGAGESPISLDAFDPETRYALEPRHAETPEKLFDRRWALTLLDRVLERLRTEHQGEGKAALFTALEQTLPGGGAGLAYSDIGHQLGMTEGAVKVAAHRLKERYRQTLREEIGRTVQSPDQIDEEVRNLMNALSGR